MPKVIAIDGPASSGKSTLAKLISKKYKYPILSSGRIYRAIALEALNNNIRLHEHNKIIRGFPKIFANKHKYVVVEGRDIGTVVFPEAKIKLFMWASPEVRAKRRYKQIQKSGGKPVYKRVYSEIIQRDKKDFNRKVAPLKPAANSVLLDTSYLDIEQVFNTIVSLIKK